MWRWEKVLGCRQNLKNKHGWVYYRMVKEASIEEEDVLGDDSDEGEMVEDEDGNEDDEDHDYCYYNYYHYGQ